MFNKQKKHFTNKLVGVQKTIWDLEFKRNKTRMIREEIRSEYDASNMRIEVAETQLKTLTKKEDIKLITEQKALVAGDRDRFLAQIKALDVEIDGSLKTTDYPDGADGLTQQLDALRELMGMLGEYIKRIH